MKVITISSNNPIFIELQLKSLKKFLKVDFEFIVFNDGKDWDDITNFYNKNLGRNAIIQKCNELGIKCINISNSHHKKVKWLSQRHSESLKVVLEFMKNNIDEYLLIDSDMFLIDYFNLESYRNKTNAVVTQTVKEINYIWPNFFYMDLRDSSHLDLIDFNMRHGFDSGSCMDKWLSSVEKDNKIYKIHHLCSLNWDENDLPKNINKNILNVLKSDPRNQNNKFFYEIYDNKFLHYRAGTNWMNDSKNLHDENILRLEQFFSYQF